MQEVAVSAECANGRTKIGGKRVEMGRNVAYTVVVLIGKPDKKIFCSPMGLCPAGGKVYTGQIVETATDLGMIGIGITVNDIPVQCFSNGSHLYGIGATEKEYSVGK